MTDHQHCSCRLSGLVLLLVGLLYLMGIAADPVVHAIGGPSQESGVVLSTGSGDDHGESEPAVPHGDTQCMLCLIAGPITLPQVDTGIEIVVGAASRPLLQDAPSRAPPAHTLAQPRAPPSA
jgi:hypothetical protein